MSFESGCRQTVLPISFQLLLMKECVVDPEGSLAQMLLLCQYVILKARNSKYGMAVHIAINV